MLNFKPIEETTLVECEANMEQTNLNEYERQMIIDRSNELISNLSLKESWRFLEERKDKKEKNLLRDTVERHYEKLVAKENGREDVLFSMCKTHDDYERFIKEYNAKAPEYKAAHLEEARCIIKLQIEDMEQEQQVEQRVNNGTLTPPKETIMEKYPEYKFMPVSICNGVRGLVEFADYVCTNYVYTMFVKNRKFGVMENGGLFSGYKVIIPAEYDKLTWKKRNNILIAEKDGKQFLIDIYGNILN